MYKTILNKNRRCQDCGKIIKIGEETMVHQFMIEKYYPVKGIMQFPRYHNYHINCYNISSRKEKA